MYHVCSATRPTIVRLSRDSWLVIRELQCWEIRKEALCLWPSERSKRSKTKSSGYNWDLLTCLASPQSSFKGGCSISYPCGRWGGSRWASPWPRRGRSSPRGRCTPEIQNILCEFRASHLDKGRKWIYSVLYAFWEMSYTWLISGTPYELLFFYFQSS